MQSGLTILAQVPFTQSVGPSVINKKFCLLLAHDQKLDFRGKKTKKIVIYTLGFEGDQ